LEIGKMNTTTHFYEEFRNLEDLFKTSILWSFISTDKIKEKMETENYLKYNEARKLMLRWARAKAQRASEIEARKRKPTDSDVQMGGANDSGEQGNINEMYNRTEDEQQQWQETWGQIVAVMKDKSDGKEFNLGKEEVSTHWETKLRTIHTGILASIKYISERKRLHKGIISLTL
jgi:hypothetical protein